MSYLTIDGTSMPTEKAITLYKNSYSILSIHRAVLALPLDPYQIKIIGTTMEAPMANLLKDSSQDHQKPDLFKPQSQLLEAPTVNPLEDSNQDQQKHYLLQQNQLVEAPTARYPVNTSKIKRLDQNLKQQLQVNDFIGPGSLRTMISWKFVVIPLKAATHTATHSKFSQGLSQQEDSKPKVSL